jgi:ATP-dependent DNA helicase PIF1
MTQEQSLDIMKKGLSVFLTGQPGTGKTYTVNKFLAWAYDNGKQVTVAASTGIAATHIGGSTIHSFLGVRNDDPLTEEDLNEILGNQYTRRRIFAAKILIIDEVSMLSAQMIENLDTLLRAVHDNTQAFGGIQMIFVGDFFQLPPVKAAYAFESDTWNNSHLNICYLEDVYRQSDPVFIDVLQGIRNGELTDAQMEVIKGRYKEDVSGLDCLRIETTNKNVDDFNERRLDMIDGKQKCYQMTSDGHEGMVQGLIKSCMSPERLFLKVGARVMFTKNDGYEKRYVNGTQGVVIEMQDDHIKVETNDGETIMVTRDTWERAVGYGMNKNVLASVDQMPLRLAYAITTHKSQGATFDRAVIDMSQAFESGQTYVALSRVKSLEGLYLQGQIGRNFLKVSDKVKAYDKLIRENHE